MISSLDLRTGTSVFTVPDAFIASPVSTREAANPSPCKIRGSSGRTYRKSDLLEAVVHFTHLQLS